MYYLANENYAYLRVMWKSHLRQINSILIRDRLPQEPVDFLVSVGLPVEEKFFRGASFNLNYVDKFIIFESKAYLIIGQADGNGDRSTQQIALSEHSGEVNILFTEINQLQPLVQEPVQFVNSSIIQYLFSLIIYNHYQPAIVNLCDEFYENHSILPDMTDDEILAVGEAIQTSVSMLINEFKLRLKLVDSRVLVDESDYWSENLLSLYDL